MVIVNNRINWFDSLNNETRVNIAALVCIRLNRIYITCRRLLNHAVFVLFISWTSEITNVFLLENLGAVWAFLETNMEISRHREKVMHLKSGFCRKSALLHPLCSHTSWVETLFSDNWCCHHFNEYLFCLWLILLLTCYVWPLNLSFCLTLTPN